MTATSMPAGPMAEALNRFALQAGVSIAVEAARLQGLRCGGLKGAVTVHEGFARLLEGSGLAASVEGTVVVVRPAAAPAPSPTAASLPAPMTEAVLQTVTVTGQETVLAEVQLRWSGGAPIATIGIRHPGDAHARIVVRGDIAAGPLRAVDALVFDGVSGELLAEQPALRSNAKGFRDLMLGLHEGLFAGPVLRALYVLSGLLGAAMIATGLVLWTLKRRQRIEKVRQVPHPGLRLVEKLDVATVIGLPVAVAACFWANRLLPLVNARTTDRHLAASLPAGDWVFAGFDLAMLALGLAFAVLARHLARVAQSGRRTPAGRASMAPDPKVEATR